MGDRFDKFLVTREFAGFRWFSSRGLPWPITPTTRGLTLGVISIVPWGYLVESHEITTAEFRGAWAASVLGGAVAGWAIGRSRRS